MLSQDPKPSSPKLHSLYSFYYALAIELHQAFVCPPHTCLNSTAYMQDSSDATNCHNDFSMHRVDKHHSAPEILSPPFFITYMEVMLQLGTRIGSPSHIRVGPGRNPKQNSLLGLLETLKCLKKKTPAPGKPPSTGALRLGYLLTSSLGLYFTKLKNTTKKTRENQRKVSQKVENGRVRTVRGHTHTYTHKDISSLKL